MKFMFLCMNHFKAVLKTFKLLLCLAPFNSWYGYLIMFWISTHKKKTINLIEIYTKCVKHSNLIARLKLSQSKLEITMCVKVQKLKCVCVQGKSNFFFLSLAIFVTVGHYLEPKLLMTKLIEAVQLIPGVRFIFRD